MSNIVKFRVGEGKVFFQSKFLHGNYYNESLRRIPPYRTFGGTTPVMGPVEFLETLTHISHDNLVVNLYRFGNNLAAISDLAGTALINPTTLDFEGLYKFKDQLDGTVQY
jgi:hypothetical protein